MQDNRCWIQFKQLEYTNKKSLFAIQFFEVTAAYIKD